MVLTPLETYFQQQRLMTGPGIMTPADLDRFFRGLDAHKPDIVLESLVAQIKNPSAIQVEGGLVSVTHQQECWVLTPASVALLTTVSLEDNHPVWFGFLKSYGMPAVAPPAREKRVQEIETGFEVQKCVVGYDEPWLLYDRNHEVPKSMREFQLKSAFGRYNTF